MKALKDVGGISPVLQGTALARSPIWSLPVDKIVPIQLFAYRTNLALQGRESEADAAIEFLLGQIKAEQGDGLKILDYKQPRRLDLTMSEIARGFEQMTRPFPAVILFAVETDMDLSQAATLTWAKARRMTHRGVLSSYARMILRSQPLHISSDYVFWRYVNGSVQAAHETEREAFDVFGCVWAELREKFRRVIVD